MQYIILIAYLTMHLEIKSEKAYFSIKWTWNTTVQFIFHLAVEDMYNVLFQIIHNSINDLKSVPLQ